MIETYLNKVTQGDCYQLIKDISDNSIDCIYTDIPYLYCNGGHGYSKLAKSTMKKAAALAGIDKGINHSIFEELKRVCKKLNMFVWCSKMQILNVMSCGQKYNTDLFLR